MTPTTKLLLAMLALATCGFFSGADPGLVLAAQGAADQLPFEGTIVAVGDSLTAGYGIPEAEAYPAQLERKLRQDGYRWRVINAGISGETSSGTLSRINWVLKLKPDIVILEIGANDGFRGIKPELLGSNLDKMVSALRQKGVIVVLAGMKMITNLGPSYVKAFADVYPKVAARHHAILVPFFLAGVAGDAALNQADTIHPVAKGYQIVTARIYPYVLQAIEKRRHGKK